MRLGQTWTPEQIAAIRAHQRDNAPMHMAKPTGHPAYGMVIDLGGGRTAVIPKHEVDRLNGVLPPMYDPTQDYSFGPDAEQIQKLNALAAAAAAPTEDPTAQPFRPRTPSPQGGFSPGANAAAQQHFNELDQFELLNKLKMSDPAMNNNYRPTGGYAASGGPTFSTDEGGNARVTSGGLADTEQLKALNLLARIKEQQNQPDFVGDFWRQFQAVQQGLPVDVSGHPSRESLINDQGPTPPQINGIPYSPGMVPTPKALERIAELQGSMEQGSKEHRNLDALYNAGLLATDIKSPGDVTRLGKRIPIQDSRDKLAEQIMSSQPGDDITGLLVAAENPTTGLRASHLQKIIGAMGANAPQAIKDMAANKAAERDASKKLRVKKEQNAQEILTSRAIGRKLGIDNTDLLRQAQAAGLSGNTKLEEELRRRLGETTAKQLEQLNQARIQQAQGGPRGIGDLDAAKLNIDMAQLQAQINQNQALTELQRRQIEQEGEKNKAGMAAANREEAQQVGAVADPEIKALAPQYGRYASDLVGKYNAAKTLNRPLDGFSDAQRRDAEILTHPKVKEFVANRGDPGSFWGGGMYAAGTLSPVLDQLIQLSPESLKSIYEDVFDNDSLRFKKSFHHYSLTPKARTPDNIEKLKKLRDKLGITISEEEEKYLRYADMLTPHNPLE